MTRRLAHRLTSGAAILVVLGHLVAPARAIDTPNERITLVGLTAVHVVMDEIGDTGERQGVSRARLQSEVEGRLRRAGLRVLTPAEALTSTGRPTLHLRVSVREVADPAAVHVFSVDLTLRQHVRLVRDRAIESYAITWSEHRVVGAARAGLPGVVRSALLEKVDEFVAAWRMANRELY